MENPFEFGRELGADELVNRVEELAAVEETIRSGGKLFVIGPRRFGKTSLLKSAAEKSAAEGNLILRYNAESFPEIDGLVTKIIEDSARALKGTVERVGEQIKKYFKSLRPEVSFSVTQTQWKSSIGVAPSAATGQIGLLVDALNGLEELAAEQPEGSRVALIIDEFQEILNQTGVAAEKQIRSAVQTHRHTAYIFAGSKTRFLTGMTTDPSRPFYRLGKLLFVGVLPRPEFARFLTDKFTYGDFFSAKMDGDEKRELIFQILDVAEDVPYNVQMLAHSLWNRLLQIRVAPEKAHLTKELIDETLEKLLRQNDPFYTQVWNALTAIQKKALVAVVTQDGRNLQSNKVTMASGVGASSMRKSLEALSMRDILRQDEEGGEIRFRFEDPFFARWIQFFNM
jgi:hypothetical protein